jgi:hypothetical protein
LKIMPVESANKPPSPPPDKLERFRPEMPQIPGVNQGRPGTSSRANDANKKRLLQLGGLAATVLLIGIVIVLVIKRASHGAPASAESDTALESSSPSPKAAAAEVPVPDGPIQAATVEEMAKPWSAKQFTFVKPFTHEKVNAMVIRLPGEHLWAFARQEPYGHCELEFVTDVGQIAKQYEYRASHPMVASPCSGTVYDPMKIGAIGANVFVRGEIVRGSGLRPPISIDVVEKGGSIIADRIE